MLEEDTDIAGLAKRDTIGWKFSLGDRVVCVVGKMKGLKGVFVANRSDGRVLIRVGKGTYVELPRICLIADS